MDEPRDIRGRKHRMFRHDPETTPQEARELFGEFADHACLDHIRLDQMYSDWIKERTMDTCFCQGWQGDEKSKYCRKCAHPGDPCYELWERVCQLATNRLVFTNNKKGKAFGNRYRIESPQGNICYLQMLQGARSRFPLPMEDFLYVTITGKGGVNETPSGTRQYPFVDLLLEIIASDPDGAFLIRQVKSDSARAGMDDLPNIVIDKTLLEPFEEWEWPADRTKSDTKREPVNVSPKPEQPPSVEKSEGICPWCGSSLTWHTAKKTGERYRGCTNYPACKYNERSY